MTELVLEQLAVRVGKAVLLRPCSGRLASGQLVAIAGANGAGKSTLLKAIAGLVPASGQAHWDGIDLAALPQARRARMLAYLPQSHDCAWPMPVADMVALGRFAHGETDRRRGADCARRVDAALSRLGISHLAERAADRLSGGEAAQAALARVLVADAPLMLLDEPVAALDIAQRGTVMADLASMAASEGRLIVAVMHDLSLVRRHAHAVMWLSRDAMMIDRADFAGQFDARMQQFFGVGERALWPD